MPLPTTTQPLAPMSAAEAARPSWLASAPPIAREAWAMVSGLSHGESVPEVDIFTTLGLDGRLLPVEVSSTLVAAGLSRCFGPPDEAGRCVVRWQRAPWRAPTPCRKCGRPAG
jgi:hypothetical protein